MNSGYKSVLLMSAVFLLLSRPVSPIQVNSNTGQDSPDCWTQLIPCRTLLYALGGAQKFESVEISLMAGTYSLPKESLTTFNNKSNISIVGEALERATVVCDESNETGFTFNYCTNIKLRNIALVGCGALHNSTSSKLNSDQSESMAYLEFRAAMYFLFCSNVTIEHVLVTNSIGTGVVFYSTVGHNVISSSNFTENSPESDMPGGGGVAVEFAYCIPGDTECNGIHGSNIPHFYSQGNMTNASYTFESCHFSNNQGRAGNFSSYSFIIPHTNYNMALGRGAGLSLLYKGNATSIPITVIKCKFEGNSAVWGGGMLIEFQDNSSDNIVTVTDSIVTENRCYFDACSYRGTGGGGARIQFASFGDKVRRNTVKFTDVLFSDNKAYFGGGLSFFTFPSSDQAHNNELVFENCTWNGNKARLGSALDLSLWNLESNFSTVLKPVLINSTFDHNSIYYTNLTGTPAGIGTIYANSVPIIFTGESNFLNNEGSALVALDAGVTLDEYSRTYFEGNQGRVGGGIALFNKAFLELRNGSFVMFRKNKASLNGGGIHWEGIGDHQLISSRNCFIRYSNINIDPSQWPVKLVFEDNIATLSGHAIYAATLLGCLWGDKAYGILSDSQDRYNEVFCWNNSIWDYGTDNCNDSSIISTAPSYYANNDSQPQCGEPYSFSVIPGKPSLLDVRMMDDRHNRIKSDSLVFLLRLNTSHGSVTKFTTYENLSYFGDVFENAELKLSTIQPRIISTMANLEFEPCPPGFVLNADSSCDRSDFPFIQIYSNLTADIQFGYWMGVVNESSLDLYVGQCLVCPWRFGNVEQVNYMRLPQSIDKLNDLFCRDLNREGVLCSHCIQGYCTAVNSAEFKCIDHKERVNYQYYSWLIYVVFEYVPLTVMLIVVFIFNISVTSGPANAFIFFAQVISTTFGVDSQGQINYRSITHASSALKNTYRSLYGIWNLDFSIAIEYDSLLFCLGPNVGALEIMALKFVTALYPLMIIGLVIILVHLYDNNCYCIVLILRPLHRLSARCLRRFNVQRSLMDSLATFLILSYAKFAVTSCFLLYPNPLLNSKGEVEKGMYVSYFDGTVQYTSKEYAPYLLMSSLVIIWCIFLPGILLFYSLRPCYACLDKYGCRFLQPGEKMNHFLNSFHHCLKDGTNGEHDRRYFAAIYFFLKLILISTYAYALNWTQQYLYQQVVCTLAILLVGSLQPYKKMWYNVLDMAMFSLLAIINVISLYNRYWQALNVPLPPSSYYTQIILVFVPLVYFAVYTVKFIVKSLYCKKKTKTSESQEDLEFSFSQFMNDVVAEDRFENNNYYGNTAPEFAQQNVIVAAEEDKERLLEKELKRTRGVSEPAIPSYQTIRQYESTVQ